MTKRLSKLFSIAYAAITTLNVWNTYYAYVEAPKIWGHRKGWLNLYESAILASFKTNYNDVFVISFNAISALMAIAALHHCFSK
jgi:hypothetical protein